MALVKPPGFFQRLFGGFKINLTVNASSGRASHPGVQFKTSVHRSQNFQVRDTATGETRIYHSLEEVPEKYRGQIGRAMAGGPVSHSEQITFVGPDGTRHSCKSLDELPPDVRKMIEDAQRSRNGG
jgi:hypothetical protein